MLEIKVTVDIPGLPEAITALAAAMAGTPRTDTPDVKKASRTRGTKKEAPIEESKNAPEPVAPAAPEPITTTPTTAAPTPVPETPPAAPVAAAPVAAPPTGGKPLTMNDIATAGAQLIDKGKMGQLLELLKKHNVQAVTQLKEADYAAFAEDLRALGAEI